MIIKGLVEEDFVNYKKPSMFIIFPTCSWKCEKECGEHCCQNSALAQTPNIDVPIDMLIERYMDNSITQAVVCGGLEPMDSWSDIVNLIDEFRKHTEDDIVIYTGYTIDEICTKTYWLGNKHKNIIFKFGRFIPNQQPHYDKVLGIKLASNNQYAERIS